MVRLGSSNEADAGVSGLARLPRRTPGLGRGPRAALVVVLGVGLVLGLAGGLGGCSRGSGAQSPTTAAPASATVSAEERDIAEAKAAVRAFVAADAKTASNGFTDWRETVLPLTTGKAREKLERQYPKLEGKGYSSQGSSTVEMITPHDYAVDEKTGTVTVTLHLCFDSSALRKFENGVEQTPGPDVMIRWVSDYNMERPNGSRKWLVANEDWTDTPC